MGIGLRCFCWRRRRSHSVGCDFFCKGLVGGGLWGFWFSWGVLLRGFGDSELGQCLGCGVVVLAVCVGVGVLSVHF